MSGMGLFWVSFLMYWISYAVIRPNVKRKNRWWRVAWLGNMIWALGLIWTFGFRERWMAAMSILMAVAVIGHHGVIWLGYSRFNHRYSRKLHTTISHLLFFIPFGMVGIFGGEGPATVLIIGSIAMAGVLAGLGKLKLNY